MSADNWGICPKCAKRHAEGLFDAQQAVRDNYGIVSLDEFIELQKDVVEQKLESTEYKIYELREDYEFYLKDTEFFVTYRARCYNDECDFEFSFKHNETMPL